MLGELIGGLEGQGDYRILLMPDHPTPLSKRTHTAEEVPYLIYDKNRHLAGPAVYNEETAWSSGNRFPRGHLLMDYFLKNEL